MDSNLDRNPATDEMTAAAIRAGGQQAFAHVRQLFFEMYDTIETTIASRLRARRVEYDAGLEFFNDGLDYLIERIFTPTAMSRVIARFDPAQGSLRNWLQTRIGFVVRDWLKQPKFNNAAWQHNLLPVTDVAAASGRAQPPAQSPVLDRALATMTAAQRASVALLLARSRVPSPADLQAMAETAGLTVDEIRVEIQSLAEFPHAEQLRQQQSELDAEIQTWHVQLTNLRRREQFLGKRLVAQGMDSSQLDDLRREAANLTQEQIFERRRGTQSASPSCPNPRALRTFELCCRELARAESRVARLRKQHAAQGAVPLVEYAQIARVLRCSIGQINGYLHRARSCVENVQKEAQRAP